MRFIALLALIFVGTFTGTALAQTAVATTDFSSLAQGAFEAVVHGQWWAAMAGGVMIACGLALKYLPASWTSGTKGDIVGTVTAFLLAFAGSIAAWAVTPGAVMSGAVALTAAKIGITAVGGYTIIHKVAAWLVASGKMPAWAEAILTLVTSLVGSNAVTVAKAEAAGAAAVAANPATGMAGGNTVTEVK